MKKLLILALSLGILSSLGHFYLAKRAYQLQVGTANSQSICNIGENINCDSALLSPYAKVFGISISNFGLAFTLTLSVLLLCFFLFGLNTYWKNISFYLSGLIAFSSVIMAVISLLEHLYCPVCWTLYLLSFVITVVLFFAFKPELIKPLSFVSNNIKEKTLYILGACILGAGLFFHISFVTIFDIKSQEEVLKAEFNDWQYQEVISIQTSPLLRKGKQGSKMLVVEFADFLCPACKRVQAPLKEFLNRFPDVDFQFYVYPLDKTCNPSLDYAHSGLSCKLSKAIICGERQGKGWMLHDFIFENQRNFIRFQRDDKKIKNLFEDVFRETGLNKKEFEVCMKDSQILNMVKESALTGEKAHVEGTPSFYVNGKKIQYSSKLLVLQKIYEYLQKQK